MTGPPEKRYVWRRFVDMLRADSDATPSDEYLLEELPRILRERIKKITGLSDWKTDPNRSLSALGEEVDGHEADGGNPHRTTAQQVGAIPVEARGAANGVASLGSGGQVPESQIPAVAITDTFAVSSEAAMLALTAQRGDVAVRSDLDKSFILRVSPAATLGNWTELRSPTDAVLSVDGQTGAVDLSGSYPPGDAAGAENGQVWTYDSASRGWLPKDAAGGPLGVEQERMHVAPVMSAPADITVTVIGWQSERLPFEISVPALGAAPVGYKWLLDIVSGMRLAPPPNENAAIFWQYQFDRRAVDPTAIDSVNGGGNLMSIQAALPLMAYGVTPPSMDTSFTVNFYMWANSAGMFRLQPSPTPACRVYLVKV